LRGALSLSAGSAALYAFGCGSGDDGAPAGATPEATPPAFTPNLLTQEFVAGQDNRFVVGLLDADNRLVKDAAVHARFFVVGADGSGTLQGEGDMTLVELTTEDAHTHDKSVPEHVDDGVAFYIVNTPFPTAGKWGAEIAVTPKRGASTTIQAAFEVLEAPESPALGATPPASRNDTSATVAGGDTICTRDPVCTLHDIVIGDVLGKGRPLVVQFSTPAFCETRFCGPVLEVLLGQAPEYEERVDFVHIEVWRDFQAQKYREAVQEWNLPGEPYTFFMDSGGKVVGRLEAIFSEEELAGALANLARA